MAKWCDVTPEIGLQRLSLSVLFSPLFSLVCCHVKRCHMRASHGKELREASGQHPTSTQVLGTVIYKTQNPPNNHLSEFGLNSHHAVHALPRTQLSYNWKFVPFDYLHPFFSTAPSNLWQPSTYSLYLWVWFSFFFFFSDSTYKWEHTVFAFLCLSYLT